jgi:hypothetical protein
LKKQTGEKTMNDDETVKGMTCFAVQEKYGVCCKRETCKHWIDYEKGCNCAVATVQKEGSLTLQEIGKIYKLTRMRICQIEKSLCKKITEELSQT